MSNINDYLNWRGDIPINSKYPFNIVDSMILARFSYMRFDLINVDKKETIESISNKMKDFDNDVFIYNGDKELITNLGKSERFKNMLVTDVVYNYNKKIEKQFGAVTIHISGKEMYVSYIGTNSTIYGWKEDFNMAFMDNVPCQIEGKNYIEKICNKYPNKKIRVGGHSKGGNVAIYASLASNQLVQNHIIKVDNFDGPGFTKDFLNKNGKGKILKKIETFIPQDSIIGRVLNHKEKITIAFSTEKGIYQHDIFSWQVLKDKVILEEKNTINSEDMNIIITDWLEKTTVEQRKVFIDSIFEIIYSTDAETFGELSKTLTTNIPKILKKYKTVSEEDKKIITSMLKLFIGKYLNVKKDGLIQNIKKTLNK